MEIHSYSKLFQRYGFHRSRKYFNPPTTLEISMFLLGIKFLNQPLRLRAVTYQIKSCMQNTRKLWSILKSIMGSKRKFTYVY